MALLNKYLLLFITLFFIISCSKTKVNADLIITLNTKTEDTPFRSMISPFSYLDSVPANLKGIINNDSVQLMNFRTISSKDLEKLKYLHSAKKLKKEKFDNIRKKIYALTGFRNGKQFYILDVNGNMDFSDDKTIDFSREIGNNTYNTDALRDSFPNVKVLINMVIDSTLIDNEMFITVYPDQRYYGLDEDKNVFVKKREKPFLKSKRIDYLLGYFEVNGNKYKIALHKNGNDKVFIIEKKEREFYKINDSRREEYQLLDTIEIEKAFYRIDKLTNDPIQLRLKKLALKSNVYGFRTGQIIKDYAISDLSGNSTSIKNLFKDKELILIDFWGTWCGPCKESTPKLVELNNNYKNKMSMVGLAYEKDPEPVIKYVKNNNMNWFNGIIKGTPKSRVIESKIISELRIQSFPTYILLDKNLKIIYRGGGTSLYEIEEMVKNF